MSDSAMAEKARLDTISSTPIEFRKRTPKALKAIERFLAKKHKYKEGITYLRQLNKLQQLKVLLDIAILEDRVDYIKSLE